MLHIKATIHVHIGRHVHIDSQRRIFNICMCIYIYTHIHMHTYMHACIYIYIYIHIYITHINTYHHLMHITQLFWGALVEKTAEDVDGRPLRAKRPVPVSLRLSGDPHA